MSYKAGATSTGDPILKELLTQRVFEAWLTRFSTATVWHPITDLPESSTIKTRIWFSLLTFPFWLPFSYLTNKGKRSFCIQSYCGVLPWGGSPWAGSDGRGHPERGLIPNAESFLLIPILQSPPLYPAH